VKIGILQLFVALAAIPAIAVASRMASIHRRLSRLGIERHRAIVLNWAKARGYDVLEIHPVWFGPWPWKSSAQRVFTVKAVRPDGRTANGWAKSGGFFIGSLADRVEVQWAPTDSAAGEL
jgi:hypothetical protein